VNDNIRAIWNQAASSHQQAETSRETQENFINRFAELIVRECIANYDDLNSMKYIADHFGIKIEGLE